MDPSLLRPRRSRAGSEASSQAGGFATDAEGDVGVVVPGTPAPSDRWAMISRRLEMVERSVMQARVSDSGGGKRWKADKKAHARRKGRGNAEESLEPTHAAGVVAERMDGALPRIDEGDVHEMQKEISKRWQSPPRPRGGVAPRPANRRRGVVARRKKGGGGRRSSGPARSPPTRRSASA
ncbi:hypothetical protein JL720_4289 [Aureococcus anophagefferens]|nr:hypothetical protein JL720_4289 [Aureococcus anophagefferens]